MLPGIVKPRASRLLAGNLRGHIWFGDRAALYPNQLLSRARRRGASGGRRRNVGRAHPPRGTPPNLARRGEIATKTQKLRPALSVNTQPNHVLPLGHFGATSGVCDGSVVRTGHHGAVERSGSTQQCDLTEGPPCICWCAAKAHHRSGTSHSRPIGVSKGNLHI
jgi:hypothetical protein